jgi:hypothetical protein
VTSALAASLSSSPKSPTGAPRQEAARERVLQLRQQSYSVYDIQQVLSSEGLTLSHTVIHQILRKEGLARLPRRRDAERPVVIQPQSTVTADVRALEWNELRSFEAQAGGLFVFVPTLVAWTFDKWIQRARLPGSQMIPALNSMLSMLALNLTGKERLSHVMDVCNDPGFSLFAALNVLPKTPALSTYSYRVTREMTVSLLKSYHQALQQQGLLRGERFNLDFHAIPHRGEEAILEKHYVSKRSRRERSVLVFLVQASDSHVLCYSNATLNKHGQAEEILRFAEFWQDQHGQLPPLLIFDSQLTTYHILGQLDKQGVRFITLRRRGKALMRSLAQMPPAQWKRMRLGGISRRFRNVRYYQSLVSLRDLHRPMRQIAVVGLGHEEPTLFITNDEEIKPLVLVEQYAHRMLIENAIAENVDFFQLDALSSAIALQVDLDVMLTLIANALYRSLARHLEGFEKAQPKQIFRRFLNTPARVKLTDTEVKVTLRRRSHHPSLLASGRLDSTATVPWWEGRRLQIDIG